MTRYLVKLSYIPNPVLVDSDNYHSLVCNGLHYNWFKQFLSDMHEVQWVQKQ